MFGGLEGPLLLLFSGVVATTIVRSTGQRGKSDAAAAIFAISEEELSAEPEEAEAGGTLEDSYEVGDVIGSGHFATVRRGVHRKSGEAVAVKAIAKSRTEVSAIRREVAILRKVGSHKNIVALRDVYETENEWFLVMELVTGGELFERLVKQGPYSEKEASRLMRQIAQGVAWLHSQGVCHRDLKPENLLLSEPDTLTGDVTVKICDFGLSVALGQKEEDDSLKDKQGTWAYWAPEMFNSQGYGKQVDMWSLGVIMYILLAGRHPFDAPGRTDAQMRRCIQTGQLSFAHESWADVSDEAKSLIRSLLRLDPRERLLPETLLWCPWIVGTGVSDVPLRDSDTNLKQYQQMRKKWSTALVASMHKQAVIRKRLSDRRGSSGGELPLPLLRKELGDGAAPADEATVADSEARDLLADAFKVFDPEGKGYVHADDLAGVIQRLGQPMTPAELTQMVSAMDEGNSGKIHYQQYLNMAATTIKEKAVIFREGNVIFREGDASDYFYLITSGRVRRVTRPPPERFEQFVAAEEELGAGDYFGTSAILGSGERKRHSTMIAMTDVRVVRLGRDDFEPEQAVGEGGRSLSDPEQLRAHVRHGDGLTPSPSSARPQQQPTSAAMAPPSSTSGAFAPRAAQRHTHTASDGGSSSSSSSGGSSSSSSSSGGGGGTALFVATDFDAESLLPTRFAVMAVGVDSLNLAYLGPRHRRCSRVLDVCCGSGVQGLVAAATYADAVVALDVSHRAVRFCNFNAHLNEVAARLTPYVSDVYAALPPQERTVPFDAILANPPFVAVPPPPADAAIEALWALYADGGPDGADVLNEIVRGAADPALLRPGGLLAIVSEFPNLESAHEWIPRQAGRCEPCSFSTALSRLTSRVNPQHLSATSASRVP